MLPSEVPSDLDVDDESLEALGGRWTILVDLYSEFQGAALGYALFAILWPGLIVASVIFEWGTVKDNAGLALFAAAFLFVVFGTISIHSWIWFRWARRRERRVHELMRLKGQQELKEEEKEANWRQALEEDEKEAARNIDL